MTPVEICNYCISNGWHFALYRLPKQSDFSIIIEWQKKKDNFSFDSIFSQQRGFIIAPLKEAKAAPLQFIHADTLLSFSSWEENLDAPDIIKTKNPENIALEWDEANSISTLKSDFLNLVHQAKELMANQVLKKVVLSAVKVLSVAAFEASHFFQKMSAAYPDVMVYMAGISQQVIWMGATPELLLQWNDNKLSTVALAGTQPINTFQPQEDWLEKDKNEQWLVKQHIASCFYKVFSKNASISATETVSTGHLLHLKTNFLLEESPEVLKHSLFKFLKALHPTPAVAGTPTEAALDFIQKNELHPRNYYTGFIGPVNIQLPIQLFVNLRCMEYAHKKLFFYSGAGITPHSIAEQEWDEIQMKAQTLIKLL